MPGRQFQKVCPRSRNRARARGRKASPPRARCTAVRRQVATSSESQLTSRTPHDSLLGAGLSLFLDHPESSIEHTSMTFLNHTPLGRFPSAKWSPTLPTRVRQKFAPGCCLAARCDEAISVGTFAVPIRKKVTRGSRRIQQTSQLATGPVGIVLLVAAIYLAVKSPKKLQTFGPCGDGFCRDHAAVHLAGSHPAPG
jgi:hypothetical protein